MTTDSPVPAVVVVEEADTDSNSPRRAEHTYMGPFDGGVSVAALQARLGAALPDPPATVTIALGERLLHAIDVEATSLTPWRNLDDHGCRTEAMPPSSEPGREYGCCGESAYDWIELEDHALVADRERDFFGFGPIPVCAPCHDRLHEPLGPGADELMFSNRPLCPKCSAMQTYEVIWGMPAGPPGPGTRLAGCVITDPFITEYLCGACDFEWSGDDDAYQPLTSGSCDTAARARIAATPPGVYRPFSRKGEPGRVVIGTYSPNHLSADTAWGPG